MCFAMRTTTRAMLVLVCRSDSWAEGCVAAAGLAKADRFCFRRPYTLYHPHWHTHTSTAAEWHHPANIKCFQPTEMKRKHCCNGKGAFPPFGWHSRSFVARANRWQEEKRKRQTLNQSPLLSSGWTGHSANTPTPRPLALPVTTTGPFCK